MNEAWLIFLGSFLSLSGTAVVASIKKYLNMESIKKGILVEANELQMSLAMLEHHFKTRAGTMDRQTIDKIAHLFKSYSGDPTITHYGENYQKYTELSDQDIVELNEFSKPESGHAESVKPIGLPYLSTKVSELSLFPENFQQVAMSIFNHINIFNELVGDARFFFKLTFDSQLSPDNHHIAQFEQERLYKKIGERAGFIIDRISVLRQISTP